MGLWLVCFKREGDGMGLAAYAATINPGWFVPQQQVFEFKIRGFDSNPVVSG
jgi:hypothetical protein